MSLCSETQFPWTLISRCCCSYSHTVLDLVAKVVANRVDEAIMLLFNFLVRFLLDWKSDLAILFHIVVINRSCFKVFYSSDPFISWKLIFCSKDELSFRVSFERTFAPLSCSNCQIASPFVSVSWDHWIHSMKMDWAKLLS